MLTILIPAAGAGSRFAVMGEHRPKPLIDIAGKPMAFWAQACLAQAVPDCRIVFVVLRAHDERFGICGVLSNAVPGAAFAVAPALTGGSLQTCLLARDLVADGPLVVLDCDFAFRSTAYQRALGAMIDGRKTAAGLLLSFRACDPRFSYAEMDGTRVVRTVEKQAISDRALVGAYGFRESRAYFDIAARLVRDEARVANGEFYNSSVYNELIRAGETVSITDVDEFFSFGTPEELQASLANPRLPGFLSSVRTEGLLS
jgi:dTDP-glucose pyrophosphorylase